MPSITEFTIIIYAQALYISWQINKMYNKIWQKDIRGKGVNNDPAHQNWEMASHFSSEKLTSYFEGSENE